jgi:hypothetical protein
MAGGQDPKLQNLSPFLNRRKNNMSVLIVGGDHLGSIPKELKKIGVDEIRHMNGRNRNVIKRGMPMTMLTTISRM